jgi:hypothetical protein
MASRPNRETTALRQHIRKVENDTDLELVSITVPLRRTRTCWKHRVQSSHVFRVDRITDQFRNRRKNITVASGEIVQPALATKAFTEFHASPSILD